MMGQNPILQELAGLSPGAQQTLVQAHASSQSGATAPAAPAAPQPGLQAPTAPHPSIGTSAPAITPQMKAETHPDAGPAPSLSSPQMRGGFPHLTAPPAPNVNEAPAPRGTLAGDEAERSRLLSTGSGISQIHSKIENSGFGQAHPTLGKVLGWGAEIPARAAEVAGSLFGPTALAEKMIPGTEFHHIGELRNLNKSINQDSTQEETAARTANLGASTAHEQAETSGLPEEQSDKHNLSEAQTGNFNSESWLRQHPNDEWSPVAGAQGPNGEPLEHSKLTGTYRVAPGVTGAATESSTKPPETKSINVNGVPHVMGWNPQTKKFDVDQGLAGEKPPSVNVNAGDVGVDRLAARLGKPYQAGHDKASDQYDRVDEAMRMLNSPGAEGKALALPKILTGLVSGQGTGVRITQPELNAIATARGVKGDVEGFFNSISGEGKLSAEQIKELTGILSDVRQRLSDKDSIHSQALDKINGAASREDIQAADKEARKLLNDYEHAKKIGTMPDGTRVWTNDGTHLFSILTGQEVK